MASPLCLFLYHLVEMLLGNLQLSLQDFFPCAPVHLFAALEYLCSQNRVVIQRLAEEVVASGLIKLPAGTLLIRNTVTKRLDMAYTKCRGTGLKKMAIE